MPPAGRARADSGSAHSNSADEGRSEGDDIGVLSGDEALQVAAEILAAKLLGDPRLEKWSGRANKKRLVTQAGQFLAGAFGDSPWPSIEVTPALVEAGLGGVVEMLLEALEGPLALGEDELMEALEVCNQKRHDQRILRYYAGIRGGISAQGKSSAAPQDMEAPTVAVDNAEELTDEINVHTFEELAMPEEQVAAAIAAWEKFRSNAGTREAAGEMIYTALFEGAPSLQALFTTPRAVQSMRFMDGMHVLVMALEKPAELKVLVETLSFGHLNIDVTIPRVVIFRDAMLDLFEMECGASFTTAAKEGWTALLSYVGGAIIFCKKHYKQRIDILTMSWKMANDKTANAANAYGGNMNSSDRHETESGELGSPGISFSGADPQGAKDGSTRNRLMRGMSNLRRFSRSRNTASTEMTADEPKKDDSKKEKKSKDKDAVMNTAVPTTYTEMFEFNAAVMGFGGSAWLKEVLASFDNMVKNVANSSRLDEECSVLALKISKCTTGSVNLAEYKSCMLAALRSLLPKVWDSSYELAWSWLWENIERLLQKSLGCPPMWERDLSRFMATLDKDMKYDMRKDVYTRFFSLAPAGQDYLKQSNTRLHYIAEKIFEMTLEIYHEPHKLVEEISALGLRHVGYGIPTELIGPYVTASIEVVGNVTDDKAALDAYRWSLGLIAKILVRTISEGSTIVMKAVNANSSKMLKKAISCAPRGSRADWVLNIQVGTQHISPLSWAIESGMLDAASAIIKDLLTIRADRERYYYGMEPLFQRHPDIVKRLCDEAPTLVGTLLEGLIWRSRRTKNGLRRVNYYVKYIVVNEQGNLSDALKSIAGSADHTIIAHPVMSLVSDTLWSGVVRRQFILSKVGFLFSLVVFMLSQAILPKANAEGDRGIRTAILIGRVVNYSFSMCRLSVFHGKRIYKAYTKGNTRRVWRVPLPNYLLNDKYSMASLLLLVLIMLMCFHEPMLYCVGDSEWPTEYCGSAAPVEMRYVIFSMTAMAVHWFLLIDMAVFSTKMAAFVLVCFHVLSEVTRFLVMMALLLATFSSAVTCLRHQTAEFSTLANSATCLFAITVGLYEGDYRELQGEPALLTPVFLFVTLSAIILINLLIAQLNYSYEIIYSDMVGFARLTRAKLIVEILASCPPARWNRFVGTLRLEQPVEFDEGDVGLPGAIQVREPASLNPVMVDSINRYGGTCSPDMQWPEDKDEHEEDRFERIERLMQTALKRVSQGRDGASAPTGSRTGSSMQTSRQGPSALGMTSYAIQAEDSHSTGSSASSGSVMGD